MRMDPAELSSHELATFHSPHHDHQATISSRPKNIVHEPDLIKNNQRLELDFQSASKDRERTLAPVDGGFLAWRFIFLSFLVEGYVWGIPLSFGVFLDFPPYSQMSSTMAAIIGTLCTGILYCIGSIVLSLMENFPRSALYLPTVGTLVCSGSFVAASYSTKVSPFLDQQSTPVAQLPPPSICFRNGTCFYAKA
ncbi:hypothetical protein PGTUg99_025267 [Puccinia graminis f. sp. tritici]|uniref:Uncharacterized protein n=1 Tax=Puccinia graminis f. sp. tritici TaxID=56615 RepID=A0A5B0S5U4_PUCGR|nr:hypothetical protein PGTUg99_025267 [Puccinia graminis f. sp. tritici]